jgi:hypothetical protein
VNTHGPVSVAMAVACAAASVGCPAMHGGAFEATGFRSTYGYEIPYERGTQRLLPADWTLVNFEQTWDGGWARKTSNRDLTTYELDDDGDRAGSFAEWFRYAVRYEHRVHAGVIWLRDIPIQTRLRNKDLHVLMQTYIDEIAGATYETVQRGSTSAWAPKPQIVVEHRQAAAILEEGPAVVAGQPAYAATIDVANIDEVHVAPRARTSRVQLVLLRAPQDEVYEPGNVGQPTRRYPVILLAGYSNMPADFAKGLEDFHGLLRKLAIGGKSGLALDLAPAAPAPPADMPPAATAPADLAPALPPAQP